MRALDGRIAEHAKTTFHLGVLRPRHTTSWISRGCRRGTSFPMTQMRTPRRPSWTKPTQPHRSLQLSLLGSSKRTSLPSPSSTPLKTHKGGMVACRKSGPRSPCNRLAFVVIVLCNRAYKYKKFVFSESTVWPIEALCVRTRVFLLHFLVFVHDLDKLLRGISRS